MFKKRINSLPEASLNIQTKGGKCFPQRARQQVFSARPMSHLLSSVIVRMQVWTIYNTQKNEHGCFPMKLCDNSRPHLQVVVCKSLVQKFFQCLPLYQVIFCFHSFTLRMPSVFNFKGEKTVIKLYHCFGSSYIFHTCRPGNDTVKYQFGRLLLYEKEKKIKI